MANFEISNISISGNRLVIGDTVTVAFTLKNTLGSGCTIKQLTFRVYAKETGTDNFKIPVIVLAFNEAVSIANGKSKSFEYTTTIAGADRLIAALNADASIRALPVALDVSAQYTENKVQYGAAGTFELIDTYIMRSRCTPTIDIFELERAINGSPSDEGENVLATLKLGMADANEAPNMRLALYYFQGEELDLDSYIDLTGSIGTLLNGVDSSADLITATFSNGFDWNFILTFGDAYEAVEAPAAIFRAFANLHLSGASTGGACFGGFGTSTEGNPKLESYFPGFFYAGIRGITNYSSGEVKVGGTYTDGKPIYRSVIVKDITANTNVTIASDLDIETLISLEGMLDSSGVKRPLNYYNSDSNNGRLYYQNGDLVVYNTRAGTATVIAIYTKASDQPEYDQAALIDANGSLIEDKDGNQVTVASETGNTVRLAHTAAQVDQAIERTDELYGAYISGELGGSDMIGTEYAGQLLYVGADGKAVPLKLGKGLAIQDGALHVSISATIQTTCGQTTCGFGLQQKMT